METSRYESFINRIRTRIHGEIEKGRHFMCYIDISEFQTIQHLYGGKKAEELLKQVEAYMERIPMLVSYEHVFEDCFVFFIATEHCHTEEEVRSTYFELSRRFLVSQRANYPECNLNICCGVYCLTNDNFLQAIEGANMARKQAKLEGSISAVIYDEEILRRFAEEDMREQMLNIALQEERFLFYLQPKVDLRSGEIVGAEALARMVSKEGDILPPSEFVDLMEANGTIVELDYLILQQVCKNLSHRLRHRKPVVPISVNLSRIHVKNPMTAQRIRSVVESYHVAPDLIEFEVTENILLHDFEDVKVLIQQLRGYGYKVSVDDFGSGYAGINIWQEIDFDVVKLDRRFLADDPEVRSRNTAIVPNIINISQRLGTDVICEGVETEAQCEMLLRLGCTMAQGFYFSKPVPAAEFYKYYEEHNGGYAGALQERERISKAPAPKVESHQLKNEGRSKLNVFVIFGAAAVLVLCVLLAFTYYSYRVNEVFRDLISDNLRSYTTTQMTSLEGKVEDVASTLQAFSELVTENSSEAYLELYLNGLNEYMTEAEVSYQPVAEFASPTGRAVLSSEETQQIAKLREEEIVLSDIESVDGMEGKKEFSIYVPVVREGQLIGRLEAVLGADLLIQSEEYTSPYGSVFGTYLIDEVGHVRHCSDQSALPLNINVFKHISYQLGTEVMSESDMRELLDDTEITCIPLGMVDGDPYYVMAADMEYNDWKYAVVFRAHNATEMITQLTAITIATGLVLVLVIVGVLIFLFRFVERWRNKGNKDAQRYLLMEEFSDTILMEYDCIHDVMRFTPNAAAMFGSRPGAGVVVRDCKNSLFTHGLVYYGDYAVVQSVLSGERKEAQPEIRIRIKDQAGNYYWVMAKYKYIYEGNRLVSIVGKIVDIDEQQRYEDELRQRAQQDGMTELYNKLTTVNLIKQSLYEDASGSLLVLDIDNFKRINDTYGHTTGDEVIQAVAQRVRSSFRYDDIVGRIGGDELVVFMRKTTERSIIEHRLETLRSLMNDYTENHKVELTLSVGIACAPDDGSRYEELFNNADRAMYEAKRLGKDGHCFSQDVSAHVEQ